MTELISLAPTEQNFGPIIYRSSPCTDVSFARPHTVLQYLSIFYTPICLSVKNCTLTSLLSICLPYSLMSRYCFESIMQLE